MIRDNDRNMLTPKQAAAAWLADIVSMSVEVIGERLETTSTLDCEALTPNDIMRISIQARKYKNRIYRMLGYEPEV